LNIEQYEISIREYVIDYRDRCNYDATCAGCCSLEKKSNK